MEKKCFLLFFFLLCRTLDAQAQTNTCFVDIFEQTYWTPSVPDNVRTNFITWLSDIPKSEAEAFHRIKGKYESLIKRWSALYLVELGLTAPRTLYIGSFTEKSANVLIYDQTGQSFWTVGNVSSFEKPHEIQPALVTRIESFDFLLGQTEGLNARAYQLFLIKWRIANCVMDGMRIDVSEEDIMGARACLNSCRGAQEKGS